MRILLFIVVHFTLLFISAATTELLLLSNKNDQRMINKNENITLKCPNAEQNSNEYLIKWFKNDEKLLSNNNNNNKKLKIVDSYLKIKQFNVYDIGVYKCQIINGNGLQKSFNLTLKINLTNKEINEMLFNYDTNIDTDVDEEEHDNDHNDDSSNDGIQAYDYYMRGGEAPSFIDLDSLVTKKFYKLEKSELELNCNARGLPMPEIIWLKNSQIISEEDIGNTRNSMVLRIKNLNVNDNGNYTCQLTNEFGKINRTFTIQIYENLPIGVEPLNQTVTFASNVKFKCDIADGFAQITWLVQQQQQQNTQQTDPSVEINGELYFYLKNNERVQISENYLSINQVTYNDIGYYLCIINNSRGYNYRKAYLSVLPSLSNKILFSTSVSTSNETQNVPIITILIIVISSISAFTILGLFIYFCKHKANKIERKTDVRCSKKIVLTNPKLLQQQQQYQIPLTHQQQQVLLMPQQHHHHQQQHYVHNYVNYPKQQQQQQYTNTATTFVSNSLRKSVGSQRSSNINTTNTNSTTVTKLNDLNYDVPQQQQQQQQSQFVYPIISEQRLPEYDNYIHMNQKLQMQHVNINMMQQHQQQHYQQQQQQLLDSIDYNGDDDDMIGWSDSSSNMSRPYAKIQYTTKE